METIWERDRERERLDRLTCGNLIRPSIVNIACVDYDSCWLNQRFDLHLKRHAWVEIPNLWQICVPLEIHSEIGKKGKNPIGRTKVLIISTLMVWPKATLPGGNSWTQTCKHQLPTKMTCTCSEAKRKIIEFGKEWKDLASQRQEVQACRGASRALTNWWEDRSSSCWFSFS
jgi:hypothetical protein